MSHQPTPLLSRVRSGPVGVCVIGLQLDFLLHSSLVPDCLVGSRPSYDSTVELGQVMCHGLYSPVALTWFQQCNKLRCSICRRKCAFLILQSHLVNPLYPLNRTKVAPRSTRLRRSSTFLSLQDLPTVH